MAPQQTYSRDNPPETLCLLRLSALGDITHVLPTLRTLQHHWPTTKISWIIGKTEYQLVKDIENVNFIIFDKSAGLSAYRLLKSSISQQNNGKAFDVLLHMQLSIRASIASLFIPAKLKLGFDKERAKDLQSLFCNRKIKPLSTRQHVLDSFLEFPRYFKLPPIMQWQLPVAESALASIKQKLPTEKQLFVINPCAVAKSKNWRNWTAEGYAAVADSVSEKYDMQIVLTGGNTDLEKNTASEIISRCKTAKPINLVAQTSISEMVATLHLATIVLAPDTGPVHISSALGTKTVGLYASTNPDRAGPYNHKQFTVNKYTEALQHYYQQDSEQASWGKRIKTAECMSLISVNDVLNKIEEII